MTEGYTVTNTFKVPDEKVNVNVTKNWEDTEEQKDNRPEKLTIVLKSNSAEVEDQRKEIATTESTTTVTFENLPKYDSNGDEITYTATEEGNNKFYTIESTTGNMQEGYTITNKFQRPTETIELTVNKVWVDNTTQAQRRPASIVINVKAENADGKTAEDIIDTVTLDTATQNSHAFTNLPKYNNNGDEIIYKVEEAEANAGDLHFYSKEESEVTNIEGEENKKQATITNTFTKPNDTTSVKVTKTWEDTEDQKDKRPSSLTIILSATNGEVEEQRKKITTEENKEVTFDNLPKYNDNGEEIEYTVREEGTNEFYTLKETQGNMYEGYTLINTFQVPGENVNVKVTKNWIDTADQKDKRPEKVTIVLKSNSVEVAEQRKEIATKENTTVTFENLPRYDSNGNAITYTATEEGNNKFYTVEGPTGNMADGYVITNRFQVPDEKVSVKVTKNWEDTEDQKDKRPEKVTIVLKSNSVEVADKEKK